MNAVAKPATPYPLRHLVSAAEYLRMGESGVFARETRLELIEGEVVEMAPIGSPHAGTVIALIDLFSLKIGRQALLSAQSPLALSDLSVPQPDLAVLRRREDHYTRTHRRARTIWMPKAKRCGGPRPPLPLAIWTPPVPHWRRRSSRASTVAVSPTRRAGSN